MMEQHTRQRSTRLTAVNLQQRGFLRRAQASTSSSSSSGSSSSSSISSSNITNEDRRSSSSSYQGSNSESSRDHEDGSSTDDDSSDDGDESNNRVRVQQPPTVKELKKLLKERGLPTTGNKADLINRLEGLEVDNESDASAWNVAKLKNWLKTNNLPSGGNKQQLIARVKGEEHVEQGSFEDFNRYTNSELAEKLKFQNRDTGGNKEDLINRLMGKEPPMPTEGWENSKDREMLFEQLEKTAPTSFRFKTSNEVNLLEPYNRWPRYRFEKYFKSALLSVLKDEAIVSQDNRDFQALSDKNPRADRTRRGEPFWDSHRAKDLLERDLLDAMECDPPKHLTAGQLWMSREEYREFAHKTFSNHVAQQIRYFRQFPGWQKKRNEQAFDDYRDALANERRARQHESEEE